MKKLFLALVSFWLILPALVWSQAPLPGSDRLTPNINLLRPPFIDGTWGQSFDENWQIIDKMFPGGTSAAGAARVCLSCTPIVPFPTSPTTGTFAVLTDGINATTCATGGGTNQNLCQWTGATWVIVSSGGGGGGGGDFGSITTGTSTGQTLTVGNGSTLGASGTGTITATAIPFTGVTGTASDAQIPNLNTLSTGLTASRCVRSDGSSFLVSDTGDCLNVTTLQAGTPLYCTASNASDTYTCTLTPALITHTTGMVLNFRSTVTPNTGTATVNAGPGAITIVRADGTVLQTGDLLVGPLYPLFFDGTNFRMPPVSAAASGQPADNDLTAIAAQTGTGIETRIGVDTWALRSMAGTTGNIVWTFPDGVGGNPTADLGVTAVQTDQTNTYTTGDQNMAAALSFTPPAAPGAAPSAGRFAYDTTTTTFKGGTPAGVKTFAMTDQIQPLNTNLTTFSVLTGAAASIPYFTGPGAMALVTLPLCIDSGGQHLNVTSLSPLTVTCGTSGGGGTISGLTTGTIPKAASPTTLTNSIISETAGVATVAGGLVVGTGSKIGFNTAALTTDRTWTILDVDGTIRPSTGVLTAGNMVTTNAGGQLIDGGAVGTGTWTDSSTNTGTNKTLVASGAGGTNTITVPVKAFWDGGALVRPSTSTCTAAALTQINSGPSVYTTTCTDASTSAFEGSLTLTQAVTTVTFQLTVNDVDSSSHVFGGDFSAMCRGNNTTVNNTWGTSQSVAITMTTASNNYTGTTAAVTPNGTCSAGATLFFRFIVNTATFTDDGDARVIGVLMQQTS